MGRVAAGSRAGISERPLLRLLHASGCLFVFKVLILRLYRDSASLRPRCTIGRIIAWSIRLKGPV